MDVLDLGGQIDSCALLARATRWIHMRDWKELYFYGRVRSRRTDRQLCTAGARHALDTYAGLEGALRLWTS